MTRFRVGTATAAQWTAANPILLAGEVGAESDTGLAKIGDGTTRWSALNYTSSAASFVGILDVASGGTSTDGVASSRDSDQDVTVVNDLLLGDAAGGAVEFTLPSAVKESGRVYHCKKTDSSKNAVKLTAQSGQTIDDSASIDIKTPKACVTVKSDGSNWQII